MNGLSGKLLAKPPLAKTPVHILRGHVSKRYATERVASNVYFWFASSFIIITLSPFVRRSADHEMIFTEPRPLPLPSPSRQHYGSRRVPPSLRVAREGDRNHARFVRYMHNKLNNIIAVIIIVGYYTIVSHAEKKTVLKI